MVKVLLHCFGEFFLLTLLLLFVFGFELFDDSSLSDEFIDGSWILSDAEVSLPDKTVGNSIDSVSEYNGDVFILVICIVYICCLTILVQRH